MADTGQAVSWALEQSCPLRKADAVADPVEALNATAAARAYSHYKGARREGCGIFGDICVTAYTSAQVPSGLKRAACYYPSCGFVISREFEAVGGINALVLLCAGCPANAQRERAAGCAGMLYRSPNSSELQHELEGIISRLELRAAIGKSFPTTEPLWYGFWAKSPLTAEGVRVLGKIVEAMAEQTDELDDLSDLQAFVRASELARQRSLRLHVSMPPPGHVDCGFHTNFPHCPFCKAEARLRRWQRRYPTSMYTCHVCGTRYSPAETASSRRMDLTEFTDPDLREILGQERFVQFARFYLLNFGLDEADADAIIAASEAQANRPKLEQRYIKQVLFAGLHPVSIEDEEGAARGDLFTADEFAELLKRCEEKGISVRFMYHRSQKQGLNRSAAPQFDWDRIFAAWRKDGCNELFGALFDVPDELLKDSLEGG